MTDDFSFSAAASSVAAKLIESSVEHMTGAVRNSIKDARIALKQGFSRYIENSLDVYGKTKTLIGGDANVAISQIYVPLDFSYSNSCISDSEIPKLLTSCRKLIAIGTAGGGKTIFLKHLNQHLIKNFDGILPIFFELNRLNNGNAPILFNSIYDSVREYIPHLTEHAFREHVKRGKFALLMDGYDEINYDNAQIYLNQIEQMRRTFPKSLIIVSSRPDESLSSLSGFETIRCTSMSQAQCVELLIKTPYDETRKIAFARRVDEGLFEQYKDFLSNPLLASMMLLTYSEHSDIPKQIHIFYQQAFEVLFHRHDRIKGAFRRITHASLDIGEFERVLDYFCAASYADEKFRFSELEITNYLIRSISHVNVSAKPADILADLTGAVCILKQDGLSFTFVHRSFQEFFTARFISRLDGPHLVRAMEALSHRANLDSVASMVVGLDEEMFESEWALDTVTKITKYLEASATGRTLRRAYATLAGEDRFSREIRVLAKIYELAHKYQSDRERYSLEIERSIRRSPLLRDKIVALNKPHHNESESARKTSKQLLLDDEKIFKILHELVTPKIKDLCKTMKLLKRQIEIRVEGRRNSLASIF